MTSKGKQEHEEHLKTLFKQLNDYGLMINPAKCIFAKEEITSLGYHISGAGTKPLSKRVKAITEFPKPKTINKLCRFSGVNFYLRFAPKATTLQPLNNLLR